MRISDYNFADTRLGSCCFFCWSSDSFYGAPFRGFLSQAGVHSCLLLCFRSAAGCIGFCLHHLWFQRFLHPPSLVSAVFASTISGFSGFCIHHLWFQRFLPPPSLVSAVCFHLSALIKNRKHRHYRPVILLPVASSRRIFHGGVCQHDSGFIPPHSIGLSGA